MGSFSSKPVPLQQLSNTQGGRKKTTFAAEKFSVSSRPVTALSNLVQNTNLRANPVIISTLRWMKPNLIKFNPSDTEGGPVVLELVKCR